MLAWPALSQIAAHLILITALQGDSFHFTEGKLSHHQVCYLAELTQNVSGQAGL